MRLSAFLFASVPLLGLAACAGDEFQTTQPLATGAGGGATSSWTTSTSSATGGAGGHGGTTSTGSGGTAGSGGATTSTGSGGTAGSGGATTSTGSGGTAGSGGATTSTGSGGGTTSTSSTSSTSAACNGDNQCVEAPPDDWHGPVALAQAASVAMLPTCAAGLPVAPQGGQVITAEPCTACKCGSPTGGVCGSSKTDFLAICGDVTGSSMELAGCKTLGSSTAKAFVKATPAPVTGSECTASGGELGAWSWTTNLKACSVPKQSTGCAEGQVCAGRSGDPFSDKFCVYRAGDQACPSGPYSKRVFFHANVTDTRACGSCGCEAPEGRTCGGTVQLFSADVSVDCTTIPSVSISVDGTCQIGSSIARSAKYVPSSPEGGACSPVTANVLVEGEIKPKDPVTVCCMP